ncbi:MAG: hypothetical protein K0R08_1552 [Solimicrobium sp.]|jgi:hypothetical protein|nr:hypothetical protein [Solimicrobium sp.]
MARAVGLQRSIFLVDHCVRKALAQLPERFYPLRSFEMGPKLRCFMSIRKNLIPEKFISFCSPTNFDAFYFGASANKAEIPIKAG